MRWRHKKARLQTVLRAVPDSASWSLRRRQFMRRAVAAGFRWLDAAKTYSGRLGRHRRVSPSAKQRRRDRRGLFNCENCRAPYKLHRDAACPTCGQDVIPF